MVVPDDGLGAAVVKERKKVVGQRVAGEAQLLQRVQRAKLGREVGEVVVVDIEVAQVPQAAQLRRQQAQLVSGQVQLL